MCVCPSEWPCVSVLFSVGVERIQSFSLCMSWIQSVAFRPIATRGCPLTLTLHKLLHITLDYISHHSLHWSHTGVTYQTLLISQALPLSGRRVLFSVYHCDSYFTDPVLVFSLVLVLPCLFSRVQILACVFWITFSSCRSDSVCPCLDYYRVPG